MSNLILSNVRNIEQLNINNLPKLSIDERGFIYFLFDEENSLVYIGKTININKRIEDHIPNKRFSSYSFICVDIDKLDNIERKLIKTYKPVLNKILFKEKLKNEYLIDVRNVVGLRLSYYNAVNELIIRRKESRVTECNMAEKLNVSRGTFRAFEKGKKIDLILLLKYGEEYDIDLTLILNFDA